MVCLAPRVPGEIVGPRRLSGVVVRPLNFTARRLVGGISAFGANSCGKPPPWSLWLRVDSESRRSADRRNF